MKTSLDLLHSVTIALCKQIRQGSRAQRGARRGRPPVETWPKSGVYVGITQLGRAPGKAWHKSLERFLLRAGARRRQVPLSLTHMPQVETGLRPDCLGSVYAVGQGDPDPVSLI